MPAGRTPGGREDGRGQKRGREDDHRPFTHRDTVVQAIIRVGDSSEAEAAKSSERERALDTTQRRLSKDLDRFADTIRKTIVECAVELSTKTMIYATLIGLINADNHGFVAGLLRAAQEDFDRSLAAADTNRSRMLLRLFAALAAVNVLQPTSVLAALQSAVDAAQGFVDSGKDHRTWQPYTDFLLGSVLMSLPWGGSELAESAPDQVALLFSSSQAYMAARPCRHQPGLQPFSHAKNDEDQAAQSDSGAASFLAKVWQAVDELRTSGKWTAQAISRPSWVLLEARLAEGSAHELTPLTVPAQPPTALASASPAEAAAAVLEAFPPRGSIALLPAEQTQGKKSAIDHLIMEQYILDTIYYFDGDRVQCARKLALGLPLKENLEATLAEVLFSQMLCLPHPPLKPVAYSAIMVDVCKLLNKFPRPMSACVRECFVRMGALDPALRTRLAAWLAMHLSNWDFMWPWDRWAHVVQAPAHDPQRRFVVAVLARLVRLSYLDKVRGVVQDRISPALLPPQLAVAQYAESAANGDTDMQAADNGNAEAGSADAQVVEQMLAQIRLKTSSDSMLDWMRQPEQGDSLTSAADRLRVAAKAILTAGAKSLTHTSTYLDRYQSLLRTLIQDLGSQEGDDALVYLVMDAWKASAQRAVQTLERLLELGLISADAVVRWAFACPGLLSLADTLANDLAWEAVGAAASHADTQTQEGRARLQAAQVRLTEAERAAAEAAEYAERMDVDAEKAVSDQARTTAAVGEAESEHTLLAAAASQAEERQAAFLMLVFESFLKVLNDGKADISAAGSDELLREELDAWLDDALARLRDFTRHWHVAVAPLAERLDGQTFADDNTSPDIRRALLTTLYL